MVEWSDLGKDSKYGIMRTDAQFGKFTLTITPVESMEKTVKWQVISKPYGVVPPTELASSELKYAKVQAVALLQVVLQDGLDAILGTKGGMDGQG